MNRREESGRRECGRAVLEHVGSVEVKVE